jgi:putative PIN family toxin of toxin-antitoxin system
VRIVFDTNVVISTLLFTSARTQWLRQSWRETRLTPVVSKATVEELLRIFSYPKFKLSAEERDLLFAEYLAHAEVCDTVNSFDSRYHCNDTEDQMFIDLALSSKAVALVSGDADIQSMRIGFPIPIYTLAELSEQRLLF